MELQAANCSIAPVPPNSPIEEAPANCPVGLAPAKCPMDAEEGNGPVDAGKGWTGDASDWNECIDSDGMGERSFRVFNK